MTGRRSLAVLALALLSSGLAGCHRSSDANTVRLTVDGQAEVTRPGEDRRELTGATNLRPADRVRIRQGTAVIRFSGGRILELRLGSDVELRAGSGKAGPVPVLMAGDLLVTSGPSPFTVPVSSGGDVRVAGVARVSRGVALLVATYQGAATLSADTNSIAVPALRQAAVQAAGAFPTRAEPVEASPGDSWDQRFLSGAIDLGNQLAARSQGFSAQLPPTDGRTAAFFRALFPRLAAEPAFANSLVNPARPPGDTLVGAAITLESTRGPFAERWAAVFGFRDEGAGWGIVALDQGVDRVPLLAAIEDAIGRSPRTFAETSPGSGPTSLPQPSGTASSTTLPVRATTTTTVARGRPTGPTTPVPPTTTTIAPSGPLNTGSPLIDDTVNSLVDTLTGLLRSLGG